MTVHSFFSTDPFPSLVQTMIDVERETGFLPLSFKIGEPAWQWLYLAVIREFGLPPDWNPIEHMAYMGIRIYRDLEVPCGQYLAYGKGKVFTVNFA